MINYKLIGTALLTVGSVVGIREYLKPRDIESMLKWKGINLISETETETNAWDASFYENEEALKTLQINSHEKLKNWCLAQMKQGITDELASNAEKYCQDAPKTIMGHIIRAGEKDKFIKDVDEKAPQIIYVLSQNKEELRRVMKLEATESETEKEVFAKIGKEISKWCNDQKKSKVENEGYLANVKKYCYGRGATNAKELLDKEGFELLKGSKAYKKRFKDKDWNKATGLIDEIKKILPSATDEKLDDEKLITGFEKLCESKKDTELIEKDFFPDNYAKFKTRCATEKIFK